MSSSIDRAIDDLLQQNGFVLLRRNRHRVYRHSSGAQVVAPSSASDRRALKNVAGHIRRAQRIAEAIRTRRINITFEEEQ